GWRPTTISSITCNRQPASGSCRRRRWRSTPARRRSARRSTASCGPFKRAYYRFLRASVAHENDAHRRNYLFRIATNLVRDLRRRPGIDSVPMADGAHAIDQPDPRSADVAAGAARRVDLSRAMARLKPRERDLLWLAYAQGS